MFEPCIDEATQITLAAQTMFEQYSGESKSTESTTKSTHYVQKSKQAQRDPTTADSTNHEHRAGKPPIKSARACLF